MAYLSTVASSAFDFQNFFSAKLTSSLTASDTDIPMDTIPSISEGVLVIDWDVAASREVIFFNSKTATKVVCPSAANGRGFDGSTATTHASGANVIMAPVADYFRYIKYIATTSTAAWKPLGYTPNSVTYNGNRNYTMVFNSVDLTSFISNGMKLKGTRTVTAPTQCTSLNGTTQYYNKATPSGCTFTVTYTAMAWVKINAYGNMGIISRQSGTSGWALDIQSSGQFRIYGWNAGNGKYTISSILAPTTRWVHLAASMDMTSGGLMYMDGVLVSSSTANLGAGAAALVQSGDINVGATAATQFFNGKIAQAAVFSAVISAATLRTYMSQGLAGTETSLVSAYSFNNSINDLNANANNLTANGSAVATNADSPFGQDDTGTTLGTTEWGVVLSKTFSTNTTITVQAPEGSAWPVSGGISAMYYSTEKTPYQFPGDDRFKLSAYDSAGTTTNTLMALMILYITDHPLDNVGWLNQGTGAGTFYMNVHGRYRKITGALSYTISGTGFQSILYGVTYPSAYFTSIISGIAQAGNFGVTQYVVGTFNTNTTTSAGIYASQSNGTNGTGVVWYEAQGT